MYREPTYALVIDSSTTKNMFVKLILVQFYPSWCRAHEMQVCQLYFARGGEI